MWYIYTFYILPINLKNHFIISFPKYNGRVGRYCIIDK